MADRLHNRYGHREGRGETKLTGAPSVKAVGKSADPDFVKLTCYTRKETHLNAKRKLLDRGGGQLSDLVEELITVWLKTYKADIECVRERSEARVAAFRKR